MIKKLFAVALTVASVGAHAALTTLPVWNSILPGLSGVLFDVDGTPGQGAFVAIGAHSYKNGVAIANDGQSTFYGQGGVYVPDGKNYANWSFDFAFNLGNCTACQVVLVIDNPADAVLPFEFDIVNNQTDHTDGNGNWAESWNLEMLHLAGFNFDPSVSSVTNFSLELRNPAGTAGPLLSSSVTVAVPEPGSLALAGLALAGLGFARRRKA